MTTQEKQTNLVLLINNDSQDLRKFIVWNIEGNKPQEVLSQLQIARIGIEIQKKVFEHPLENGATIVDYEIQEPKKATLQAYIAVDDITTLAELEELYLRGTLLRVRAENRIIDNMIISSQPYEITGGMLDKSLYSISLKEADFIDPQYVSMPAAKNKKNTSRVNSGVKQITNKTPEKQKKNQSWLASIFSGTKNK